MDSDKLIKSAGLKSGFELDGVFVFSEVSEGQTRQQWEAAPNVVTNEGLNHLLSVVLGSGTQITAWNVGLKDNTGDPVDGTETYQTKVFTEITAYTEANRPTWLHSGASSQEITNEGTPAEFSINASTTVYGAFLAGGPNSATKGNSSAGNVLFCLANFATEKILSSGSTLQVGYKVSAADDAV